VAVAGSGGFARNTENRQGDRRAASKGRDRRSVFDRLLKDATRRRFDLIAAWSVDRLGRSLEDLVGFLSEIHGAGVDLCLHRQVIDTSTPAGKAMFQMLGVFSEFEKGMIVERVRAGIARAKASGKRFGRPTVKQKVADAVHSSLAAGISIRETAAETGASISSVQRIKAAVVSAQ
jgi:DNA invertase Pin-like site-specific DNA recombinase